MKMRTWYRQRLFAALLIGAMATECGQDDGQQGAGDSDIVDQSDGNDIDVLQDGTNDMEWVDVAIESGESDVEAPDPYRECSDVRPCSGDFKCVYGLCVARCHGGAACVEGQVCFEDGCRSECDARHPCTQAYSCIDGHCVMNPCGHPEYWPLTLRSNTFPLVIHYRDEVELPMALECLGYLDHAWRVETEDLGFLPPLPDADSCGPDEGFDVFLWRSFRAGLVEVSASEPQTTWNDYRSFMVVDPWGDYGGQYLDTLMAHELNHAMQASYDWWETPIFFEMTSVYIEDEVYDEDDGYKYYLYDFQQRPDWALDYNDDYETWYMYGSMLYLQYLRDGPLKGDRTFVATIWDRSRNPSGENEPDFEDALDTILQERAGMSFLDSVGQFARWRYYTGTRDDGGHFEEGGTFPKDAMVPIEARISLASGELDVSPGPMLLGMQYIQIVRMPGDPEAMGIDFEGDLLVRWSLQVMPGLDGISDGEPLELSDGKGTIHFGDLTERTLVILALPADGDDPDTRNDARYAWSIRLSSTANRGSL